MSPLATAMLQTSWGFATLPYDYGVGKSFIGRAIHWVEDTLLFTTIRTEYNP